MSGIAHKSSAVIYTGARLDGAVSPAAAQPADKAAAPVRVTSCDLMGARAELIIVHAGRDYRLRVTQNGKLILTA